MSSKREPTAALWRGGISAGALVRRRRAARIAGTVLGLLALLIQLLLPSAHQMAMAAAAKQPADARASGMFGGELAICLTRPPEKREPPGSPTQAPSHKGPVCPVCQALYALGGFIPPAGVAIGDRSAAATSGNRLRRAPIIARSVDPAARPRAPPLLT